MSLARLRRQGAPVALLSCATLLAGLFPARVVHAEEPERAPDPEVAVEAPAHEEVVRTLEPVSVEHPDVPTLEPARVPIVDPTKVELPAASTTKSTPLPPSVDVNIGASGGDKTGVSSQAIALPQGAGKLTGMGESFSAQLSTGVASFTVPIQLIPARGSADPALSLAYSSAGGHGVAGVGWEVGWPSISRQTDRGIPTYNDSTSFQPNQDRFVFGAGQELVPICTVSGTTCTGAIAGEIMPSWASGWQYFRSRVEGSYERFFWSADHQTWRVQAKSGEQMELGVPLDGSGYSTGLEVDPNSPNHVFKWNVVRQYDAYGDVTSASPTPANPVVYRYMQDGGSAYLTDIYDTSPTSGSTTLSLYAHHTRLNYAARPDTTQSYKRGWLVTQGQRLTGIDVTSKPFENAIASARGVVRRYHLGYDAAYHVSLLTSVQTEGRGSPNAVEDSSESLPGATGGPLLPAMTFDYQHVTPYNGDGTPGTADLVGYEGFDDRTIPMGASPDHSVDESDADMFDLNSDGLPDMLVTMPGLYNGNDGVFYNGTSGTVNAFTASTMPVVGALGATAADITLSNPNILAADLDGDGTIDFLHQPAVKTYAVYTPTVQPGGGFSLVGRAIPQANLQDPHLDLGSDTPDTNVMDVNGDGLVDVVRATGTEIDTFYSLGRYPNGDGNFGSAVWTGPYSSTLSLAPITSCVPWDGVPVQFSDPTIQMADMNGDGLPDIVRVEQGNLHYWPGRGDGVWGTGPTSDCQAGTFAEGTYVQMTNGPEFSDPNGSGVRLDDINGDGLDDVIEVNFDVVNIWLNVDGVGFTPAPHVTTGFAPAQGPEWLSKVRLVDMNGSGTRDIFWGEAGSFRYIDVAGGERPWVLTHVENGLGKTTDLTYSTSAVLMQAAAAAGTPWTSVVPMPVHVVTQVTDRDNLNLAGMPGGTYVTQYSYANPVYDGRQREFRGFSQAWTTKPGDINGPTSMTSSTFLLGQCVDDEVPPAGVTSRCLPSTRWTDNTREALKGLPLVSETYANGIYESNVHHTYTLRRLYTGLDGREVRVAFESATDSYAYDNFPFTPGAAQTTLTDVNLDLEGFTTATGYVAPTTALVVRGTGEAHVKSNSVVDLFGNTTQKTALGCVDCSPADTPIVSHSIPEVVPSDTGGWLWRTQESWVDSPSGNRNDTLFQYDLGGSPTVTSAVLTGTLPLARSTTVTAAPAPPWASADSTITLSTVTYDPYGNPTLSVAPNARCRTVSTDTAYAELAVEETVSVGAMGGSCGATPLTTLADYDRGFRLVTHVTDIHGEVSLACYDGFGRLSSMTKPDPDNLGLPSPNPSVKVSYYLPPAPALPPYPATTQPYAAIETLTQDGAYPDIAQYRQTWTYTDGLGRTIVTVDQADPSAGDLQPWIASGLPVYDAKGEAIRAYLPEFLALSPGPTTFPTTMTTAYTRQVYDAFGRVIQSFALDEMTQTLQTNYHTLGADAWDAEDLNMAGPHYGTYASGRKDGFGRVVSVIERINVTGGLEQHDTQTTYLPTGEATVIRRTRGMGDDVVRWMQYDSLGRLVLNAEPNTSVGFTATVGNTTGLSAWRYAYDDNGDLVGTSDARGCGENYHYDAGGRILAEDYSPCLATQATYSAPDLTSGDGTEAFYVYDGQDPTIDSDPQGNAEVGDCDVQGDLLLGRVASISDRGSKTLMGYDGRGRTACMAKQMSVPGTPSGTLSARYAPRWYSQTVSFDAADRPVTASTGAQQVLDGGGQSYVTTAYSRRGVVSSVTSGYGSLVASITRAADGPVGIITYGDLAATSTTFTYDTRRRVQTVVTSRGPPASWPSGTSSPVYQHVLESSHYHYDLVDNPIEIDDLRTASEWPVGAQPVTRTIGYDDLYRATAMVYATGNSPAGGTPDTWVDPFNAEDTGTASDPRLAQPSPHVSFTNRVQSQSFTYDWLGNTTQTSDDAGGFYERSLGTVTNGGSGAGPYQLTAAAGGTSPRDGSLTTAYDGAGNLISLSVVRASAPCVPSGASCSQRYAYDWDEVGRLVHARRWDGASLGGASSSLPTTTPAADLAYAYDASDDRTLKTATDSEGNQAFTAYVYDALELRRTGWDGENYEDTVSTEVPYLFAHGVRLARVDYATVDPSLNASGTTHVILELADHLGSSTIALDQATSELVERGTYQGYGAADSDYRPAGWGSFREDYRFTGKEEDVEFGLDYFGKRFYAPMLGRWMSADPLALHSPGSADLNVYAYVHGRVLAAVDPRGLDNEKADGQSGDTSKEVCEQPPEASIHIASGSSEPKDDKWWQEFNAGLQGRAIGQGAQRDGQIQGDRIATEDAAVAADGPQSTAAKLTPVFGAARTAYADFKHDRPVAGAFELAVALSDLAMVKTVATTGVRLVGTLTLDALPAAAERGVFYGANGVEATITSDMIGTGTKASGGIRPPGWVDNAGFARGHLLGRQLGGSGTESKNLVTLFQNPANAPVMSGFEKQIRAAVEAGEVVNFGAMPIYRAGSAIPAGVTIVAEGSGGFNLAVTVLNIGK